MIRRILAVIAGLIAGSVFNMGIIMLSWALYPPPKEAMSDPAAMGAYIQSLPLPAFLIVLIAHAGGALVGGWVAALIARQSSLVLGGIVGGFFLVGGIINVISMAAPLWFEIVDLASYIPCGLLGARLAPRRSAAGDASPDAGSGH
ncbi:MAG: hypothetical protein KIT22_07020 [Verrucomicrobiae bacterium]|nr:hypothetical protein [Verrucomicrobiae bacterium]